jgi:methylated-DNA-[protein]-cysteine S-methyltransferase
MNVWEELVKVPYAHTLSYEEIARRLGDIKTIRAAANANGRNPIPIVIPCHRIIGKSGDLTGYSGGVWRKKWLLDHESKERQPRLW